MGSSRFTNAPFFIRESDVLAHVSGARSAENDLAFISRAVRHTPLTAMLSPVCISVGACFASTVMWRVFCRLAGCNTRVTFFLPAVVQMKLEEASSGLETVMGSSEEG